MKSKVNGLLPLIIMVLIFASSGCQYFTGPTSPGQIVQAFIAQTQNGESDKAAEWLTNTPPRSEQVMLLKLDKITKSYGGNQVEKKSNVEVESKEKIDLSQTKSATMGPDKRSPQQLFQSMMMRFDRQLPFDKIISVREHEDEAKVTASFLHEGYANIDYNFLLIKIDGKWRIFDVYPHSDPEFDLYEYWAVKRQ